MSDLLIETQDLSKVYGMGDVAVHALDGVTITIRHGEYLAIMGMSGSGKSTLMNILGCLDRPTSGSYLLDGNDVSRLNRRQLADIRSQKIGFIFQSFNLLARQTALKNVMMPMLYHKNGKETRSERHERAAATLTTVGLGDRLEHRSNELSGGQQQRVAIARALINNPALILADEPTGNLDSRSGAEILDLLDELHDQGTTIIVVTHDKQIASSARRMIQLLDGRIISDEIVEGVS